MSTNIDDVLAVGIDLHFVIWQVIESTIYQLIQNEKKNRQIKFQPATLKNSGNNVTVTDIWGRFLKEGITLFQG